MTKPIPAPGKNAEIELDFIFPVCKTTKIRPKRYPQLGIRRRAEAALCRAAKVEGFAAARGAMAGRIRVKP
ncbi:MAG: hypothetical protein Q7J98_11710 [Kiritimatiellia bacterium]|nr:hypothetical protein [Kiritimatiellia bacterium]